MESFFFHKLGDPIRLGIIFDQLRFDFFDTNEPTRNGLVDQRSIGTPTELERGEREEQEKGERAKVSQLATFSRGRCLAAALFFVCAAAGAVCCLLSVGCLTGYECTS